MLPRAETNSWYGYGLGSLKLTTTVFGSLASTFVTPSAVSVVDAAVLGSAMYCQVKTTSSAVSGVPSDHLMSGLSFQVMLFWSLETPPFSSVGISAARTGTGLPSGSSAASGSSTRRLASWSLVPWARWLLRMVGACQYRIFNVPPWPRPPAAGLPAALEAVVGAGAAGAVVGLAAAVGAAAGAVVAWPPGAVVGWAAGAVVGAGVAAGPHAASPQVRANRR